MLELITIMVGAMFSIVCALVGFYAGKMSMLESGKVKNLDGSLIAKSLDRHLAPPTYDDFKNPRIFGIKMPEERDW